MTRHGADPTARGGGRHGLDEDLREDDPLADEPDSPPDGPAEVAATLVAAEAAGGSLGSVLDERAAQAPDVTIAATAVRVEYRLGPSPFARRSGTSADFRLQPDVAEAAARTPDAAISALGPEWVTFAPRSFDRFARDRATAWFDFALRLARAGPPRT